MWIMVSNIQCLKKDLQLNHAFSALRRMQSSPAGSTFNYTAASECTSIGSVFYISSRWHTDGTCHACIYDIRNIKYFDCKISKQS